MTMEEFNAIFATSLTFTNARTGKMQVVNIADLPAVSFEYLVTYGVDQQNDVYSSVTKDKCTKDGIFDEAAWKTGADEKFYARVADLIAGSPPGKRGPANPLTALAKQVAALATVDPKVKVALDKILAEAKKRAA